MGPGWLWLAPRVVVVFALGLTVFLSWDHAPPWAILVFAIIWKHLRYLRHLRRAALACRNQPVCGPARRAT